jgi:hypothetical protein
MPYSTIRNAKDPLQALCNERQLTPSGCDWLKKALDPFHDYELTELEGFPDGSAPNTVLYNVQLQRTITAPDESSTWDCHIATNPVDVVQPSIRGQPDTVYNGSYFPDSTNTVRAGTVAIPNTNNLTIPDYGALTIQCVPTGHRTYSKFDTNTSTYFCLDPSSYVHTTDSFESPSYRTVAMGFEVVNTTSDFYRQGDVTVYTQPTNPSESDVVACTCVSADYSAGTITEDTTTQFGTTHAMVFRGPPSTVGLAKQTPGARTWKASDGAYVPARMHTSNNFSLISKLDWISRQAHDPEKPNLPQDIIPLGLTQRCFVQNNSTQALIGVTASGRGQEAISHMSHYDISGAYFTGLSLQTTLTVTLRMTIELVPGPSDVGRLALARPSAPLDNHALQLYSALLRELPPGVPVGYNDAGKWFRMILSKVGMVVGHALPHLPAIEAALLAAGRPGAAGIVAAAEAAAKTYNNNKKKGTGPTKNNSRPRSTPNFGKP